MAAGPVSGPDRLLAANVFREEAGREHFAGVGIARAEAPERFERFMREESARWRVVVKQAGIKPE